MIKIENTPDSDIVIVNTHLHHPVSELDDHVREMQVWQTLFWIKQQTRVTDNVFFMGDFNTSPTSASYRMITDDGFKSSHCIVHGAEPEDTFPTGLIAQFMDTDPAMCLDYIFYKGPNIIPTSIFLAGTTPHSEDITLYPSDHKALVCDFEI